MLFMGDEYGEPAPFQFFTDHIDEEIAVATREGRRREFASFAAFAGEEVPDPQDLATFKRSKLTRGIATPPLEQLHRDLLAARRDLPAGDAEIAFDEDRAVAARPPRRPGPRRELRAPKDRFPARRPRSSSPPTPGPDRRPARCRHWPGRWSGMSREVWPGRPFPLGPMWDGEGTNFSIFSEHAERVELCLFDADDNEERIELVRRARRTTGTATCRASAPASATATASTARTTREAGHRFNPHKLLIDPYAKAIEGDVKWDQGNVHPYVPDRDDEDADLEIDDTDDSDAIPKCLVVDEAFDWEGDRPPRNPWWETVIYETHVKGFTKQMEEVREDLRGTYAGLASEPAIAHLKDLGVTAVELLPVHHIIDESFLHEKGLTNYWGYSSIGFFAPHAGYSATGTTGEQVREFKGMVKALHREGIEVILDVVYNHTAEGNHLGPMLSFKGVDNKSYYRLVPDDERHYMDYTGTGNTLNARHPSTLRLIMDSLRYWVIECHVDGFRFDLAPAPWPASSTTWTALARSSTRSTRTPSCPRSS